MPYRLRSVESGGKHYYVVAHADHQPKGHYGKDHPHLHHYEYNPSDKGSKDAAHAKAVRYLRERNYQHYMSLQHSGNNMSADMMLALYEQSQLQEVDPW